MTQCCAADCKNKGVHSFPKDPKRRKLWEAALRRKKFKATESSRLCSMHFKPEDYFGISKYTGNAPHAKFLKKTTVPSIFSFTKSKTENSLAIERQKRLEKRCARKIFYEVPSTSSEQASVTPSEACSNNNIDMESPIVEPVESKSVSKSTQVDMEHVYGAINHYKTDDAAIKFYTGFECYKKFFFVYSTLSPMAHKIQYYASQVINISTEDQFFLTIMKLRQNKCNFELSRFFNISTSTVSNIFITWVNFIYQLWTRINIWPDKNLVQYYMPEHFKNFNKDIRVILDGTEIFIQKPKHPTAQQASWSSYKHANTLKILVGATPGGLLSYCSTAYVGSVSDRQAVERSCLLNSCVSGDIILADRGFNIQDMFADKNIRVMIPTFLKGKSQLPGLSLIKDRELANKRVHIERIIGLTKTYKILQNDLDHSYIPIASKLFFLCFMCCNFRENIMKK